MSTPLVSPESRNGLVALEIELSQKKVTLYGFENDHITRVIQQTGAFYEWQMLKALGDYVSPQDLVLDVGANIGNHSVYFAAIHSAQVIAYEPVPSTAEVLWRNIEHNFLDDKVTVRRVGLGSSRTQARIDVRDPANRGANALIPGGGEVSVTTLDMERIRDRVSLIKIDVEGMDVAVLQGGVGLIMRDRPVIACEAADPSTLEDLTSFAAEIGYTFAGKYNATPTYLLVPYGSTLERTRHERQMASLAVHTNLLTRDLHYKLSLISQRLSDLEKTRTDDTGGQSESTASTTLMDRVSAVERRLDQIE